jgi:histidine triad (HIT) family protein
LFCKIVAKEIPSETVYETDDVLGFRDINPAAPTHVLLIPKEHIASAAELGESHGALLAEMFEAMASLTKAAGLESYRVVTNVGSEAGQTVHHLHFHAIGGRSLSWPPG